MKFSTKVKALYYGMEFTHGMRRALMSALALIYFLSFGFNIVSITTLFAISTLIMTFFEFPTGAIADYDSRKKSIMISLLLLSIAFFGLFIFKNFWFLAASWILGDIAWTFSSGATSAWSIDALNIGKKKSKLISLISKRFFFEKGGIILGGLVGLIIISINFSFIWLFISLSQLLMFFIVWKYMEERNFKPEKIPHHYLKKSLIKAKESINFIIHKKNKQLRALMLGDFFGILAGSAFLLCIPLLFVQILNVNFSQISGIFSLVAALTIISPFIAEKVANKMGIRNPLVIFGLFAGGVMILFSFSKSIFIAISLLVLFRFITEIIDIIGETASHLEFDSKIRASLDSVSNIIWAVSSSIAVFLAGISINFFGIVFTLIISGGLALIESMIYLFGLKKD
jgi:MFS family permease